MHSSILKSTAVLAVSVSLGLTAPVPAVAQDLGKAIVGGVLFCAMTNSCGRPQQQRRSAPRRSRGDPTVKLDQQSLNYFGYNVGGADGVTGAKTRSGISQYQAGMGYPITGRLEEYQRANLHGAYAWAQSGRGAAYPGIVGPELLQAHATEQRGGNYCQETNRCPHNGFANNNGGQNNFQQPNTGGITRGNGNGLAPGVYEAGLGNQVPATPMQPAPPNNQLPTLPLLGNGADQTASVSMAGHCQNVSFLTSANGGMVSHPNQISNPSHALDEQFCALRDDAIAATGQITTGGGITDAQLAQACGQTVSLLEAQLGQLDTATPDQAIAASAQMAQAAGWNAGMMTQTGQICLGYGYRVDSAETVLAASMLIVGAGSTPHGEVFGHHKRLGFGTAADLEKSNSWYDYAFRALESGATPAFMPAQSQQRVAVMRAALGGGATGTTATNAGGSALPTFNLGNN